MPNRKLHIRTLVAILTLSLSAFSPVYAGDTGIPAPLGPPVLRTLPASQKEEPMEPKEAAETTATYQPQPLAPVTGSVSLGENSADALNAEQIALIEDYFFYYFASLALLEPQDVSLLFAEDGASQAQAAMHTATFEVLTETRKMQRTDLRLTGCTYEIVIGEQRLRENGDLMVYATESNTQNFACLPGVDSKTLAMGHAFYMRETEDGWRMTKHWQNEDFHLLVSDLFRWGVRDENLETDVEASKELLRGIVDRILRESRTNLAQREGERLDYRGETENVRSWDRDYDRQSALEYAEKWIGVRSPDWPAYDIYGGNCNNFASQVLLAGGIPMDTAGNAQWKWFGEAPNEGGGTWGRSASWTGVNEFYQYVEENQGFGLVCDLTGSYFDGKPGDLLQLGALGDWKHTVVISQVIRDQEGEFVDYLIHSNTADRLNYPAAAYPYTSHRLIQVLGWSK